LVQLSTPVSGRVGKMGMASRGQRRTMKSLRPVSADALPQGAATVETSMSRLQLAKRIHQMLLREIDHAIEVERLLADPRYARDVLLVCEAVPGGELAPLAALFREASRPAPGQAGAPGHAPQANEWGRDTSGFGVTQAPPVPTRTGTRRAGDADKPAAPEQRRSWLPRWREPK
jgi:hypothetical protein